MKAAVQLAYANWLESLFSDKTMPALSKLALGAVGFGGPDRIKAETFSVENGVHGDFYGTAGIAGHKAKFHSFVPKLGEKLKD